MADAIKYEINLNTVIQGGAPGAVGGAGVPTAGGITPSTAHSSARFGSFGNGLSASMFLEGANRIISASGNSKLASGLAKASSYTFLVGRVAMSGGADIGADIALAVRLLSEITQALTEWKDNQKDAAKSANALDLLKMRGGAFGINANTQISYNKYGRVSFTDRK